MVLKDGLSRMAMSNLLKKVIIFGTGDNAELAKFYFEKDTDLKVAGFTLDSQYITSNLFCSLPVLDFETIEDNFPPSEFMLFIAIGYTQMNAVRETKFIEAKDKGYKLASYISPKATVLTKNIGENTFILEDNTIQPFVSIGDNNVIWSGNHIGHHSVIKNHCFITSQVTISGRVVIGNNCFIGVNSTIRDHIVVADNSLIGAHAWISKDTNKFDVYVPRATELFPKKSFELSI